mmetsp:Transcript_12088/g.35013  ORF Transcript_12088/g.35013 Transcript_12088/m.35013 type:complete len:208 (+) Transcript_12088:511-1134(+)
MTFAERAACNSERRSDFVVRRQEVRWATTHIEDARVGFSIDQKRHDALRALDGIIIGQLCRKVKRGAEIRACLNVDFVGEAADGKPLLQLFNITIPSCLVQWRQRHFHIILFRLLYGRRNSRQRMACNRRFIRRLLAAHDIGVLSRRCVVLLDCSLCDVHHDVVGNAHAFECRAADVERHLPNPFIVSSDDVLHSIGKHRAHHCFGT